MNDLTFRVKNIKKKENSPGGTMDVIIDYWLIAEFSNVVFQAQQI